MTTTDFLPSQKDIDLKNSIFWNELCGSHAARILGIKDHTPESLKKWDTWFFSFYPYLLSSYLNKNYTRKNILEVGLGYGSVGQFLAEQGANYYGLDIASGPVKMMNTRLKQMGLNGNVTQGSILNSPYEDHSFDFLISIGCFHHTGNVQKCIDETYRILRPKGQALIMVYNRYSLRQWTHWTKKTVKSCFTKQLSCTEQRYTYDHNNSGEAAPETVFLSINELKKMSSRFSSFKARKENFDPVIFLNKRIPIPRNFLLHTVARLMGLDIYIELQK